MLLACALHMTMLFLSLFLSLSLVKTMLFKASCAKALLLVRFSVKSDPVLLVYSLLPLKLSTGRISQSSPMRVCVNGRRVLQDFKNAVAVLAIMSCTHVVKITSSQQEWSVKSEPRREISQRTSEVLRSVTCTAKDYLPGGE